MRYRLAVKYKGMWVRDLSDEYDNYRSAVDLEWSQQKVKDYGNKKGWVSSCHLTTTLRLPKQETTAAPSAKPTSSTTTFSPASKLPQRQTRPLKTRAQVTAEGPHGGGGGAAAMDNGGEE